MHEPFFVLISGDLGVNTYRIPILKSLPDGSLIALSEGRKYNSADVGPKFLAMRRSTDQGLTWSNTTFIEDDGEDPDGLNLGTVFVDEEKIEFLSYIPIVRPNVFITPRFWSAVMILGWLGQTHQTCRIRLDRLCFYQDRVLVFRYYLVESVCITKLPLPHVIIV